MPNELEIFAKRLRQARIKAQLSMESLCERMGGIVSKQAISKYEGAKMMPTSTTLIALAEALKVKLDYFFRPFSFDLGDFDVSFRKKPERCKYKMKLKGILKSKKSWARKSLSYTTSKLEC